ncbi:MAG: uncharacterized protein KVP18_002717 [Porospora cf. gigantea A]|nr:MAG: hypothetical protein KVP18_002717 [Porospora cf. gigantea A]
MTPLALAMRQKTDCRQVISFALESSYSPIERLFYGGDDSDARMMNEFSRNPDAVNDTLHEYNEMTWLCICVEEARFAQAEWLMQHGANVCVRDVCGNTLLHMLPFQSAVNTAWGSSDHSLSGLRGAAYTGDEALTDTQRALLGFMTTLLSHAPVAAAVDDRNDLGDAAVHVVAETCPDPRFALWAIKILKDHGATVELENQDGSNVGMLIARSFGQGVWLDLIYELSGLDRAAADAGGERLEDYIVDADVDELSSEEDLSVGELSEGSMGFDDHL